MSLSPTRNSPAGKHMGVLPAQQPPDCTNITGAPRSASRRVIACPAAAVAVIRGRGRVSDIAVSEQPEWLGAVADEQVLGLAVVIEHHPVVLPPDAGDLVSAERGACGVLVIAVGPHPTRLDGAAHLVGAGAIARPDAGTEAVEGVVGDREGFGVVLERGDGEDRSENLLLEDAHLVVALQYRRLEEVAACELAIEVRPLPADQHLGTLVSPDLDVGGDLLDLLRGHLRAELGVGVEGVTLLDRSDPLETPSHERLVDVLLNQGSRR